MRSPAAAGLAGKGAELLSQVLLITAVPAVMGPADYGDFALALAVVMVASATVALGGPAVLTRYVPAAEPDEREAVARALVGRLTVVRAGQVAAAAAIGAVLALAASDTFRPEIVAAVVVALALDVAATVVFQAALGFGHTTLWSFRFALQNLVLAGAAIALYETGGTDAAVWALGAASGVALVAAGVTAIPRLRQAPRQGRIPAGALRFGAYQAISSLLLQLQHRGAVLAVAVLAGSSEQTGFASLALGIGLTGVYAVRQVFTVEMPGMVERSREDPAVAEVESRRLAARMLALVAPAALLGAVLGADLLELAAGEGFRAAEDALGPALALLPLAPLTALVSQVAALRLRPEARLWTTAAGLVVFVAVACLAVPSGGAEAATAATLAGTVATLAASPLLLPGAFGAGHAAGAVAVAALVLVVS